MNSNGHTTLSPHSKLLVPNHQQSVWNFAGVEPLQQLDTGLTIKLPSLMTRTRSSRRPSGSNASGSEYHASNASMDVDDQDVPEDDDNAPSPPVYSQSAKGRKVKKVSYVESEVEEEEDPAATDELNILDHPDEPPALHDGEVEGEETGIKTRLRTRPKPKLNGVIESDEEGQTNIGRYATRRTTKLPATATTNGSSIGRITRRANGARKQPTRTSGRVTRRTKPNAVDEQDDMYVDDPTSSVSGDGSLDDVAGTTPEPEGVEEDADADADAEGEPDEQEQDGRPYALRQRAPINYAIPPPLEEMKPPSPKPRNKGKNPRGFGGSRPKAPGWSATGAELSRWMGAGDDSDSDYPTRTPRKGLSGGLGGAGGGIFAGGASGMLPADFAAAGAPSNLGKVGEASLADADPLGVNQNVTFDEVGGLDEHINALKEMTLLPLLYPEVFQRFNVTPPRGVLFHGPPGTGKTLLARALAASCRSNGKGISFFMRKGADCLSKWVGEAERQLRLLFEEARNSQPSIIFFDEIDGLAPVRSSKQDQIHASIVSTLLALMDGMDGRGQVVVIGATNRPDAIDPALRRPGRFDREFYFPLPGIDARERILRIMTRKWAGWEDEKGEENSKGLAKLTKGYGGADLRALCTEAALNAVQRRYPQIYKSSDRLLLQPESINVELRDFMISVKNLIPSSARSTAPTASPLPEQLVPLLQEVLDKIKAVFHNVLPVSKKRTALEEAEWEVESEEGALEREMMLQSMETLRVHRPRIALYGASGMGQSYVAAAALHHLEGFHVQTLDIANLMSDSTRTPEAGIVQLFVEAKRHQPSVVYIPSLTAWCAAVSETSRTTLRAMLDGLAPTDPVLLLATIDGEFTSLPRDVRAWFGHTRETRVALTRPRADQREKFFAPLVKDVLRPPSQFPDGMQRKKRVLEVLPIAPPLEPRAPSAAELAMQQETDQRTLTLLKYRLGPILTELKRKFKRFCKRASDEYNYDFDAVEPPAVPQVETMTTTVQVHRNPNGENDVEVIEQEHTQAVVDDSTGVPIEGGGGFNDAQVQLQVQVQPQLFDVDLERMHLDLYRDKYLTPDDFLEDIRKIVHNTSVRVNEDPDRLFRAQAMLTAAEVSCQDFDGNFRLECQRMAARESKRREEYRKNRERNRAETSQNSQVAPVRRSARHNGQAPEMSITDPLKLERRLKRARSTEGTAEPSEEENGESHTAKRSRVSSAEMDGQEHTIDGFRTPPNRIQAVRFVDGFALNTDEPMSPTPHGNDPIPDLPTHDQDIDVLPVLTGGFDPSLLNPMPADPSVDMQPLMQPLDQEVSSVMESAPPPLPNGISHDESPSVRDPTPMVISMQVSTESDQPGPSISEPLEPAPSEPMHIERTPTPLPDFYVDMDSLALFQQELHKTTEPLNIEQLEQLRAMCLARVWHHRSAWDRSFLVQELRTLLREFVEEIVADDMDADSPSFQ